MAQFEAKRVEVRSVQDKVQTVVLPFVITGNATPASVSPVAQDTAVLFIRTQGVDQITVAKGALDSGDTAPTFGDAPVDANGVFNVLVKVGEPIAKVCKVQLHRHGATIATSGGTQVVALGDADGIAGAASDKIILSVDCSVDLSAASLSGCLEVSYIAQE